MDYGAIKLNCNMGDEVGNWFFLHKEKKETDGNLQDLNVTAAGYPFDKGSEPYWGMQLWYSTGVIKYQLGDGTFLYDNDIKPGNSGGPIFRGFRQVIKIQNHYYWFFWYKVVGVTTVEYPSHNEGVYFHDSVYNDLMYWKDL